MKKLLLMSLATTLFVSTAMAGNYGIPRPVTGPSKQPAPGIGQFEGRQALVSRVMGQLGWDSTAKFEETGKLIKDLLVRKASQDKELSDYLTTLDNYFKSAEFKNQTAAAKKKDIFTGRIALKSLIAEEANSESNYHVTGTQGSK